MLLAYEGMNRKALAKSIDRRADARLKTSQKDKSATLMECEADKTASADKAIRGASVQQIIDMLEHDILTRNTASEYLKKLMI